MKKKRIISMLLVLALALGLCPAAEAGFSEMTFSDGLVQYIKNGEGFMPNVYSDGTGYYIGYGCACGVNDYPNGITEAEADALLRQKMSSFAGAINSFLKKYDIAVTQGQFDALCGFAYNLGTSWLNPSYRLPGMLIKGVENYSDEEIVSAFAAWCHVGGVPSEGLLRRRIIEAKMFLYDDYSETADGWKWIIADGKDGQAEGKIYCYKTGGAYGSLPGATREGYTFAGWETKDGRIIDADSIVSENLYLFAKWTEGEAEKPEEEPAPEEPEEETPTEPERPETPDEPEEEISVEFPDVRTGDWFYSYVAELVGGGVINGFDDGTFRPSENVTWGQALKLVLLSAGFSEQERLEKGHWASGYLKFAEDKGYVAKGSVASLDDSISRNEIADLAAAALELNAPAGMANPFADTSRASALALYAEGIFEGSLVDGQRLFKGGDSIKRSEICAVLCRMGDYVERTWVIAYGYRVPINYSLPMNSYDPDCFYSEDDRIYYLAEGAEVRYGIDVSEHQGLIDWEAVAADGIDYAIIRVGYRGYGTGSLNEDKYYIENLEGAIAAGLDVGVYFFSQALSVEEALEEAEYLLGLIEGYELQYPVVFDWEPMNYSGSRTQSYDGKVVSDCAEVFCQRIAAAGYTPMVYLNIAMAYLKYDLEKIYPYEIWLAKYDAAYPEYIYHYDMWQYGSSGQVNGIGTRVDMNISFVDYGKE